MNEESLWYTSKQAFKRVCASTVVVFPDPLSSLPPISAATRILEGTEDDPVPTDKGDIHMEFSFH